MISLPISPVDGLLVRRLQSSRGRRFLAGLTAAIVGLLALSMIFLRVVDGPRAFFDGVVARGMGTFMLLVALPFAFSLARLGASYPVDRGLLVLFRLRGVDPNTVALRLRLTALRLAALRGLLTGGALGLLALILTLPDLAALKARVPAVLGVVGVGVASSVGLAMAGSLAGQWGRARGGFLLLLVFVLPLVVSAGLPDGYVGDLFGLYDAAIDEALRLGR
jgi:hypothetical protein